MLGVFDTTLELVHRLFTRKVTNRWYTTAKVKVVMELDIPVRMCPFCKSKGISIKWARPTPNSHRSRARIECDTCGSVGPSKLSLDKAVYEWNRRNGKEQEEL